MSVAGPIVHFDNFAWSHRAAHADLRFLVTGFDGYLFRLVDVASQTAAATTSQSVTAPEMRAVLSAQREADGLIIAEGI